MGMTPVENYPTIRTWRIYAIDIETSMPMIYTHLPYAMSLQCPPVYGRQYALDSYLPRETDPQPFTR